ncbi:EVE domain-containing protein [Polluticoccus soli]|uniref:EVE domain-containing protein n=1 Tax=Polluticoccus soli TaxID=3034150 RepID=UPI0023E244C5|nr:EVE domain-containing protein [Flavipsychrobacter sp. JY13-12]
MNYWVFQATPKRYRIIEALTETVDATNWNWMVNQHKGLIKENDKFILWVGGTSSGVYALGTITSPIKLMRDKPHGYVIDPTLNELLDRVEIKLDYNLVHNPITKSEVEIIDALSEMKYGIRGLTNLASNHDEFSALVKMAEQKVKKSSIQ